MIPLQQLRITGAVAALVAAGAAGWALQGWRMSGQVEALKRQHAEMDAKRADAVASALSKAREREAAVIDKAREIVANAQNLTARADRAAADADDARQRMLDAARIYSAARCPTATAAGRGQAGGVPDGVQGGDAILQLLGRLSGESGAYARAADRARIAGLACEAAYDSVMERFGAR